MMETIIVVLWGLSLLGGLFLTFVWGRVAWGAWHVAADQFFWIAVGLCMGAIANVLMFGGRTIGALRYGIEPAFFQQSGFGAVVVGLTILAVSKGVLMWAHDPEHRSPAWRAFVGLCTAWTIAAPIWMFAGL